MRIRQFLLTQAELKEILRYEPETGAFTWNRQRKNGALAGDVAGHVSGEGYWAIGIGGVHWQAHRVAWFYVHGVWPETIDHINGCKADNRIINLKNCSTSENNQNTHGPQVNSKSQMLGVSWHKKAKKWQAHICVYKERKYLGLFDDVNEAHKAYLKEKEKLNVYLQKTK